MWYDISKTLSYNALFNFVIGARGVGKTYAFKRWAIKDFLKNKKQPKKLTSSTLSLRAQRKA